jgi:glycosyltransferase involved in cell wall biosynthesis
MLNIFGSPSAQNNIIKHICISEEVKNKIKHVVPENKTSVMYIPSEKPKNETIRIKKIKDKFGIKKDGFVFGRIGRASNDIFDPIGINAFKEVVKKFPNSHYIIMSTPPIIKEIVEKENIPNVHFLEPSSDESDVWAFHQSLDVLAHFRNDGESCGLNIIESMLCGNPIITHKSHIWNAHLEYLKPEFSRVAEKGNDQQYAEFMEEMIKLKNTEKWPEIRNNLKIYAEEKFLIENNISKIEDIINSYDNNH